MMLCCDGGYCVVLYCIALYCIALHCYVLRCVVLFCFVCVCLLCFMIVWSSGILANQAGMPGKTGPNNIILTCVLLFVCVFFCFLKLFEAVGRLRGQAIYIVFKTSFQH